MSDLEPRGITRRSLGLAGLALGLTGGGAFAEEPPTSERARAAMARARRGLAPQLEALGLTWGAPAFVRVFKLERRAETWLEGADGRFVRVCNDEICAWSGDLGPKRRQGDLQAPEGAYFVTPGRLNPWSAFHLSFDLGYPNAYDRAHGRTGSALMIHGGCASAGCYALGDEAIERVYSLVAAALAAGQGFVRVHCFPFRPTQPALARRAKDPNAEFWSDLQIAYDLFERDRRPPDAQVRDGRYVFASA